MHAQFPINADRNDKFSHFRAIYPFEIATFKGFSHPLKSENEYKNHVFFSLLTCSVNLTSGKGLSVTDMCSRTDNNLARSFFAQTQSQLIHQRKQTLHCWSCSIFNLRYTNRPLYMQHDLAYTSGFLYFQKLYIYSSLTW